MLEILFKSEYGNFSEQKFVCSVFDIKKEKLDKLIEIAIEKRSKK